MKKFFTHADCVVPVHHPRVLVETAVEQGAEREALFESTGVTAKMLAMPETRISYLQYGTLVGNALRATKNPSLGLDVGRNTGFSQMGVLGLAIMTSPTVGSGLEMAMRYHRLFNPAWRWSLRIEGRLAILAVEEAISLAPFRVFATEVLLAAFDRQGRELAGCRLPVHRIRLAFPKPAHADTYRTFYDVPMLFDQGITEAEFDASLLEQTVRLADPATAKLATQLCDELACLELPVDGLIGQVRSLLVSARGRPPDLEQLARALQTSSRSLRRSLQEMGVSYIELLDETRRLRALELIRATRMTSEQIAERLGFSDVRSFRRAFKRWTRHTPSEYRKLCEEEPPSNTPRSDAIEHVVGTAAAEKCPCSLALQSD